MSYPSIICVYHRGRFVLAQYCKWDGYPHGDGQGMEILKFLWGPGNIERLTEGFQHVVTLTKEGRKQLIDTVSHELESGEPTEDPDRCFYRPRDYAKKKMLSFWPSLSRDTGADILKIIAKATAEKYVPIWLKLDVANRGYAWAYVIDLDQNTFEVFAESSETKQEASTTRFNDVGRDRDMVPILLKIFSLSQLPATEKEFMHALKAAMKEKGNDMYRRFLMFYDNASDSDDEVESEEVYKTTNLWNWRGNRRKKDRRRRRSTSF
jgi:hypothetical protein